MDKLVPAHAVLDARGRNHQVSVARSSFFGFRPYFIHPQVNVEGTHACSVSGSRSVIQSYLLRCIKLRFEGRTCFPNVVYTYQWFRSEGPLRSRCCSD